MPRRSAERRSGFFQGLPRWCCDLVRPHSEHRQRPTRHRGSIAPMTDTPGGAAPTGSAAPPPPPQPGPPPARRLAKSHRGRMFWGVAAGLGEYFDIDPLVFRIAFVVLA